MKAKKVFSVLCATLLAFASFNTFSYQKQEKSTVYAIENQVETVAPCYGRQALATMPDANVLLYAYDAIVQCVENSQDSISVYDGENSIIETQLSAVVDAYRRDYTEHFWLGNQYGYTYNTSTILSFRPTYTMDGQALQNAKVEFDGAVNEILAQVQPTLSDFEKELFLHDVLAERITYVEGENAHDSYGAIVKGKAVCEGYAESLQYLLKRVGIQSFIITGSSVNPSTGLPEGHAWNAVKIDGDFYQVDLTWNDQGSNIFHAYFNVTTEQIQQDHSINATYYPLPECNATAKEYFNVNGGNLDVYTKEDIASLLKANNLSISVKVLNTDAFLDYFTTNVQSIAQKAGVSGSFSYGYSVLGREVKLYISTPTHSHTPTTSLFYDSSSHWHNCTGCEERLQESEHTYSSNCDTQCNDCPYVRTVSHEYSTTFSYDSSSHYRQCACGEKTDVNPHVDSNLDEECDTCGYSMPAPPPDNNDNQGGSTPNPDDNQGGSTPNPDDNQGGSTPNPDDNQGGTGSGDGNENGANQIIESITNMISSCTGKEDGKYGIILYGVLIALAFVLKR